MWVKWGAALLGATGAAAAAGACWWRWAGAGARAQRAAVNVLVTFDDSGFRCEQEIGAGGGGAGGACHHRYCCVHNLQRIVDFLDDARTCIDICVYIFSCDALAQAVKRAHDRGVVVRIITDFDMAYNNGSRICHFYEQGIKVKSKNSNNLMHHKFCIIDSPSRIGEIYSKNSNVTFMNYFLHKINQQHRGILVNGSLNWTNQAINGNWEHVLITSHLPIIKLFQSEFNEIWKTFKEFQPY
ncbi:mitochondrial cardiolipin hydrolase-like [Arctopsyche grandis]|uniref:mitochondrial cardiolipin hydrolase-like n=1 Tax=Arctopsyche grandis TaxID=121162 RepID=UPI00406D8820